MQLRLDRTSGHVGLKLFWVLFWIQFVLKSALLITASLLLGYAGFNFLVGAAAGGIGVIAGFFAVVILGILLTVSLVLAALVGFDLMAMYRLRMGRRDVWPVLLAGRYVPLIALLAGLGVGGVLSYGVMAIPVAFEVVLLVVLFFPAVQRHFRGVGS